MHQALALQSVLRMQVPCVGPGDGAGEGTGAGLSCDGGAVGIGARVGGAGTPEPSTAMSAQLRNSSPQPVDVLCATRRPALDLLACSIEVPQGPQKVPHHLEVSQPSWAMREK